LQRVAGPLPTGILIGDTAPQIDHRPTIHIGAHPRPDLVALLEIGRENVPNPLESRRHEAVDLRH
jgi:hypothetical protein